MWPLFISSITCWVKAEIMSACKLQLALMKVDFFLLQPAVLLVLKMPNETGVLYFSIFYVINLVCVVAFYKRYIPPKIHL